MPVDVHKILADWGACDDGAYWVRCENDQTPKALWKNCDRADWLLWGAVHGGAELDSVFRAAAALVRTLLVATSSTSESVAAMRCHIANAERNRNRPAALACHLAFAAAAYEAREPALPNGANIVRKYVVFPPGVLE